MKRGRKGLPVLCIETRERWDSVNEAARVWGVSAGNLSAAIKAGRAVCALRFVFEGNGIVAAIGCGARLATGAAEESPQDGKLTA